MSLPRQILGHEAGAAGGEGERLDDHLALLLVQRDQLVVRVLLATHSAESSSAFQLSSIAAVAWLSAGCYPHYLGQQYHSQ